MVIKLINGDCFKILPELEKKINEKFDLIMLDPPYIDWEGEITIKKPKPHLIAYWANKLLDVHGLVVLFGKQPQLIQDWKHYGRYFDVVCEFILCKRNPMPRIGKTQPLLAHENVWILKKRGVKVTKTKLNFKKVAKEIGEEVRVAGHAPTRIRSHKLRRGLSKTYKLYRDYPRTVVERGQVTADDLEYVGHPTQKPLRFIMMIIKATTEEKDWVLDPFLGSGTTAVACQLLNRNCIGIEIMQEFYEIAMKRWKQAKVGLTAWLPRWCTGESSPSA